MFMALIVARWIAATFGED